MVQMALDHVIPAIEFELAHGAVADVAEQTRYAGTERIEPRHVAVRSTSEVHENQAALSERRRYLAYIIQVLFPRKRIVQHKMSLKGGRVSNTR